MKPKQLEEVKRLHSNLCNLGSSIEPCLTACIVGALVSGQTLKLRPVDDICKTARRVIIKANYNARRELDFCSIFAPVPGYEKAMRRWSAYEAERKSALARFSKEADRILLQAADPESDAVLIADSLRDAAERAGLRKLQPPKWSEED